MEDYASYSLVPICKNIYFFQILNGGVNGSAGRTCLRLDRSTVGGNGSHRQNHRSTGSGIPEQLLDSHAPIFNRLIQDGNGGLTGGLEGTAEPGTRYSAKLLSCPNIAVRCDIVEYL